MGGWSLDRVILPCFLFPFSFILDLLISDVWDGVICFAEDLIDLLVFMFN